MSQIVRDLIYKKTDDDEDVTPPGAKFRLNEILVEEVSLVDRAANKRRFLIVKQAEGDDVSELILTPDVKNTVISSLSDVLERITKFTSVINETKEDGESGASVLPAKLGAELKDVAKALNGLFLSQLEKRECVEGTVTSLVQVAELSLCLAEEIATAGELDDDIRARMNQMAELMKMAMGGESNSNDDSSSRPVDKNSPASETQKIEPEGDALLTTEQEMEKEVLEALQAQTSAINGLTEQFGALVALQNKTDEPPVNEPPVDDSPPVDERPVDEPPVDEPPVDDPPPADEPPADDASAGDEVEKALAELKANQEELQKTQKELVTKADKLEKENKDLKVQLKKAQDEPPSRASDPNPDAEPEDVNKGDSSVFPMFYGNPTYDPKATQPGQS
jgi:hypothetical protein